MLALDGLEVTLLSLPAHLRAREAGDEIELLVLRRDELMHMQPRLQSPPLTRAMLAPDRRADASAERRLRLWSGGVFS